MRLSILVATLFIASCSAMDSKPSAMPDEIEPQLVSLEKQFWAAWQKRDQTLFNTSLSPDFVEVGAYGPSDKASFIAFVGNRACAIESYALDGFKLSRPSNDTALLTYSAEQKTTCAGSAVPSPVWVSSLYVYSGGRWQNVLFQQSQAARR